MSAVAGSRAPRIVMSPRASRFGVRLATLAALALFAGLHWAAFVHPRASGTLLAMTVVALASAVAVPPLRGLRPRAAGVAALVVLVVVTLWVLLRLAGIPAVTLRPSHWGDLLSGIGGGLGALPSLRIPYRGADEWVRGVILAGGALLLWAAALLALVPAVPRIHAAALCLGTLYVVPIVEHGPRAPYLDGAVLAVLLAAFLWVDRLQERDRGLAGGLALVALVAAMVAAPRIDASRPWVDYQAIAESLQSGKSVAFSWNHSYGPLTWPRDGLELVRVRSNAELYWKTATLEDFDGLGWRQAHDVSGRAQDTEVARAHPRWMHDVHVTIKGLKSRQFVGAGTTFSVSQSSKDVGPATPGTFQATAKPLRRGDGYDAQVYVPKPDEQQMRRAGADYPAFLQRQLSMWLTGPSRRPASRAQIGAVRILFPPWGSGGAMLGEGQYGYRFVDPLLALHTSPYSDLYDLAQRIKSGARDQYEFVRNVMARVQRDARYTEAPPSPGRDVPLHAFLFKDHAGYCQHFSGAMALLLRMGGVPARVATGFSPGVKAGNEYVVRDLDAHSWVEVYYPHIGWVTYDPTPADSPARSQLDDVGRVAATAPGDLPKSRAAGDRIGDPTAGGAAPTHRSASAWLPVGIGAGALLLIVASGGVLLAGRRRRLLGDEPDLEELRRALVRCGRAPTPDVTLNRLERLLAGSDDARDYLRTLRLARYGGGAGAPTPAQRRALRIELAAGLGVLGRVRALVALPPRPRELTGALRARLRRGPGRPAPVAR